MQPVGRCCDWPDWLTRIQPLGSETRVVANVIGARCPRPVLQLCWANHLDSTTTRVPQRCDFVCQDDYSVLHLWKRGSKDCSDMMIWYIYELEMVRYAYRSGYMRCHLPLRSCYIKNDSCPEKPKVARRRRWMVENHGITIAGYHRWF